MHAAEQFEIDFASEKAAFELKLRDQWARNQAADAHNWTEEAMAMVWSLGRNDWESWNNLPHYTRSHIVTCYRMEQEDLEWRNQREFSHVALADYCGIWLRRIPKRTHIRTYREACPPVDEKVLADMRKHADEIAATLKADWAANRPPTVFTYDRVIAAMVGMRLGIRYEAIAPRDLEELNNPKKRSKIQP